MQKKWILTCILLLGCTGCDGQNKIERETLTSMRGCWKARHVSALNRPVSEWTLFSVRPDSTLALSMVFEVAPRSRVWTFDSDVTVKDGLVRWGANEGMLNSNKDTMSVRRTESGGVTNWMYIRDRSADSVMERLSSSHSEPYVYRIPETRDDGWTCANLADVGIDREKILELLQEIVRGKHDDIHNILIVKENKLVVEEYFADRGKKHSPWISNLFREKVHHLASTTKGVTSTLVGIAIDQGYIKNVEEPIYHYLPAYSSLFTEEKKRIRIRDMLTMTAGFEWRQFGVSDDRNDGMRMWNGGDVIRLVLEKPLDAEPGKKYNYTNGVPTVTGAILKNATGMEVRAFAGRYLFQPLGITEYGWTSYPDGSIETDGGLALRPRDLAKIGQLFLNNGVWDGKRIVSEQWVRESTKERLRFGKFNRWGYGYHWMQAESRIGNRIVRSYFVPGDGNQILAVFPELGMVVVFTAGNYGRDPKPDYFSLFEEFILPAALQER